MQVKALRPKVEEAKVQVQKLEVLATAEKDKVSKANLKQETNLAKEELKEAESKVL